MSAGTNSACHVTKSAPFELAAASFGMIAAGEAVIDLSNAFTLVHNSLRHGPCVALWIRQATVDCLVPVIWEQALGSR